MSLSEIKTRKSLDYMGENSLQFVLNLVYFKCLKATSGDDHTGNSSMRSGGKIII